MSKHVTVRQWESQAARFAETALSERAFSSQVSSPCMAAASGETVGTGDSARLNIQELPLCGLLTIRSDAANESLVPALKQVLKLGLPSTLRAIENGEYCLRWMSPDEWLLSCPMDQVFDIEIRLRDSLEGHVALVNVSCGYQRLLMQGCDAMLVLQKSTGYDVHPKNLPAGKVINTTFAKSQVTLRCIEKDRFELIVRRSYADYLCSWLNVAVCESGWN